ncbi:hypothetical protein V8E52_001917, partial [Russula decolorans]
MPQELLALIHHPAASRILDAIVDGPTIPPRPRRALPRAMEAQFADIFDDRIGARVGVCCWAAAEPVSQIVALAPTNDNERHDVDPEGDDAGRSPPAER